ncbi:biotin--[acetyl-CoA-carboxylase] ligase [Aureibaculum sp. 2210JD6-5]|uniref:biotin--[acetyl-CoA-carboxylase] ligase n=1 Tax=Aureibaculum sp. 2210JD6-5 TaxID=3103957 RepID=UPI002AAC76E4|nr:biotin--[acetyl-CoA-carboxylase] ligase [Aureibaculum sp. 2210JD6-5]MDY7396927.1 biotin--[acetyl-CoA-carboxylase] ligase [Aureibaculum sp. 2210JD6-5]
MKIVKLNAIDSTNAYLRDLIKQTDVKNATVVIAEEQTKGKGQGDNKWASEKGKNLTFSVLVKFDNLNVAHQHMLNYSISIAIYNVLRYYIPNKLSVKWPNDILSASKKICGILIECVLKNSNVNYAIVGVGLNVNQVKFDKHLTKATSLKKILNKTIDKEELLEKILLEIQFQIIALRKQEFKKIKERYEAVLYKKGIPSMFKGLDKKEFLGKIIGTSMMGNLVVELEDESLKEFGQKEIKFI